MTTSGTTLTTTAANGETTPTPQLALILRIKLFILDILMKIYTSLPPSDLHLLPPCINPLFLDALTIQR
eukprot:CAMPEP_0184361872 /NCGR_PEP_ID=MMETSP1089-20130417/132250_1 /TAXON_ID=38269 ORGANISM="Gloeochaete wittrockiana, Strain SAG46.84" /NCGR_SAMPLE_ID=MMETSP1089 /ASSEMBLY_ACC=CAM_ASM_000445 /LENGTH=68 /DNA_ID=CAMNT_0026701703 /DNA_START=12 /DNA_END=215 /DNA_ORIENTATION=+